MKNQEQERECGLDVLRSVSMLMVISIHVIGHGGLRDAYLTGSVGDWIASLAEIAVYPAVDCFVLLSGYLLSALPFKLVRIARSWLSALFWSVVLQSAFFLWYPDTISPGTMLCMFLPVLGERYWFLNAYIAMILVSPVLNRLLRDMPRWQMKGLLLALMAVFCVSPVFALGNDVFKTQNGYSFPWFIVMYLCGGYVRRYCRKSEKIGLPLMGYLLFVTGHLVWIGTTEAVVPHIGISGLFMKYTSVPVFGSALCLLQFFRSVQYSTKNNLAQLTRRISPLAFGVYLIHDHPLVRESFIKGKFTAVGDIFWVNGILLTTGCILSIYVLCVFMEWLRTKLFKICGIDRALTRLCESITENIKLILKGDL